MTVLPFLQRFKRLSSSFGLCIPSSEPYQDELEGVKAEELSPIALKLQFSPSSGYPSVDADNIDKKWGTYASSSTYALKVNALSLPADIDFRVRRLIRAYRLRVDDPTTSTITSVDNISPDPSNVDAPCQTSTESTEQESFVEAEPRWMLWNFAELCC